MEFKGPYLAAMREQAPAMFNELRKSGKMDEHLQEKATQARTMFQDLTAKLDKLPSGYPRDEQAASEAERQVLETLIEFPQPTEQTQA